MVDAKVSGLAANSGLRVPANHEGRKASNTVHVSI